jgi:hypothetical protein
MSDVRDESWVEVAATGNDDEASLIAGFLQSNDIRTVVELPKGGSPWPENLGAFGVSKVFVPPERAEEARRLLDGRNKAYRTGGPRAEDDAE